MMNDYEVLTLALPAIRALCEKRRDNAIASALSELRQGKLTAERAIHLWMEVNTVDGFVKSVETKLKMQTGEPN